MGPYSYFHGLTSCFILDVHNVRCTYHIMSTWYFIFTGIIKQVLVYRMQKPEQPQLTWCWITVIRFKGIEVFYLHKCTKAHDGLLVF